MKVAAMMFYTEAEMELIVSRGARVLGVEALSLPAEGGPLAVQRTEEVLGGRGGERWFPVRCGHGRTLGRVPDA